MTPAEVQVVQFFRVIGSLRLPVARGDLFWGDEVVYVDTDGEVYGPYRVKGFEGRGVILEAVY